MNVNNYLQIMYQYLHISLVIVSNFRLIVSGRKQNKHKTYNQSKILLAAKYVSILHRQIPP